MFSRPTDCWDLRESRLSVRPSVRLFVRTYATLFLWNRSLLFFWNFTVRACKREKNVPSTFLVIFTILVILAKNWSKLSIWVDVWKSPLRGHSKMTSLAEGGREVSQFGDKKWHGREGGNLKRWRHLKYIWPRIKDTQQLGIKPFIWFAHKKNRNLLLLGG